MPVGVGQLAERGRVPRASQPERTLGHIRILASPPGWFVLIASTGVCGAANSSVSFARRQRLYGWQTTSRRQTMTTNHIIGSREEYEAAREELLQREKQHTRLGDELAEQRRQLPWVPIEKAYRFDTDK